MGTPPSAESLRAQARQAFARIDGNIRKHCTARRPCSTLLNSSLLKKGAEFLGSEARLSSVLSHGSSITLSVLGGSVSAGSTYMTLHGDRSNFVYHSKVASVLGTLLRPRRVLHHNGALAATGPAWFEHCALSMLPPKAGV